MEEQQNLETNVSNEEKPAETQNQQENNIVQAKKKKLNKWFVILPVAILLLAGSASAYYFMNREEEPSPSENVAQEQTNANQENQEVTVSDNFYIADSNEKTVVFYDTEGTQLSLIKIPTELLIPSASLGVNDNIQVVNNGQRIFYQAGENPIDALGGEPLTFELFELINGEPRQLYKAPEGQKIEKWLVINNGEEIVFKTSRETGEKLYETDFNLLEVESKNVKQLTDYAYKETSWSSQLNYDDEKGQAYYFDSTGGDVTKESVDLESGNPASKSYNLTCASDNSFCGVEYPDFVSPNDKYFVWGYYNDEDMFGISIVDIQTGEAVSDYALEESYEQIGNVYWNPSSTRVGFDIQPFSNEGQQKEGREERFMELAVGENTPVKLFSDISPGIDDFEGWQNAKVELHGYSNSGSYAIIRNEELYKIFNLETQVVEASVNYRATDSATYVKWLR